MQKESSSLGKGWGSVVPNSSENVAVGLSPPPLPRRAQDPPAGMCQGFVTKSPCSLEPRAPPAPHSDPLLPFLLLPCAFIHSVNSECQIQLHSWLCSTCLFSMPVRRSPAPLAPRLRGGGSGGESRAGGEGNRSRLLLAKPLFV